MATWKQSAIYLLITAVETKSGVLLIEQFQMLIKPQIMAIRKQLRVAIFLRIYNPNKGKTNSS